MIDGATIHESMEQQTISVPKVSLEPLQVMSHLSIWLSTFPSLQNYNFVTPVLFFMHTSLHVCVVYIKYGTFDMQPSWPQMFSTSFCSQNPQWGAVVSSYILYEVIRVILITFLLGHEVNCLYCVTTERKSGWKFIWHMVSYHDSEARYFGSNFNFQAKICSNPLDPLFNASQDYMLLVIQYIFTIFLNPKFICYHSILYLCNLLYVLLAALFFIFILIFALLISS